MYGNFMYNCMLFVYYSFITEYVIVSIYISPHTHTHSLCWKKHDCKSCFADCRYAKLIKHVVIIAVKPWNFGRNIGSSWSIDGSCSTKISAFARSKDLNTMDFLGDVSLDALVSWTWIFLEIWKANRWMSGKIHCKPVPIVSQLLAFQPILAVTRSTAAWQWRVAWDFSLAADGYWSQLAKVLPCVNRNLPSWGYMHTA